MAKKPSRYQRFFEEVRALLEERDLSAHAGSMLHRFAHLCLLVWRSFSRNRCPAHASALAYATLLALVPMLAVAVGITSTFLKKEGEDRIDQFIVKLVASVTPPGMLQTNAAPPGWQGPPAPLIPQGSGVGTVDGTNTPALPAFVQDPEAIKARKEVARRINEFIQNTRSGALGLTGSVLLIFAAISMLARIEDTFNDIWGVARGRNWFMRIVLYWGVLSLAPFLIVVAVGLASGPHFESTKELLTSTPFVGHFVFQFLPVVVLSLTFALFYMLIPNTKVNWRAALVGGIVGGTLFHVNNLLNVLYVSRLVSNSKIYGSLALIPVIMIGLYFAWLILLFGAQVAYAYQNRASYLEEKQVENINQRGREFVALRLMTLVGQRYLEAQPPPTVAALTEALTVPSRLVSQIMNTLIAARLAVETAGAETGYIPARRMETITCHDILQALRACQGQDLATRDEPVRSEVLGEFQRIQEAERKAAGSVTMLALASRAQSRQIEVVTGSSDGPEGQGVGITPA